MAIDQDRPVAADPYSLLPRVPLFSLTSTDISDGQPLPTAQTSDGGSISPQLSWSGFPLETKSFLLTCFDPDSPKEDGLWLWLVADIPSDVTSIPAGNSTSMMKALASRFFRPASSIGVEEAIDLPNGSGTVGFSGAAPEKGDRVHRYYFAVHALDVETLELPHGRRTAPDLAAATAVPHTIARAVLMGTHQR